LFIAVNTCIKRPERRDFLQNGEIGSRRADSCKVLSEDVIDEITVVDAMCECASARCLRGGEMKVARLRYRVTRRSNNDSCWGLLLVVVVKAVVL
jgi:hypothetical protein